MIDIDALYLNFRDLHVAYRRSLTNESRIALSSARVAMQTHPNYDPGREIDMVMRPTSW